MIKTPFLHILVLIAFLANTFGPICPIAYSATGEEFRLPAPGVMVGLSPDFNPPILKGIKVHPDNPFQFDFILDQGDSQNPDIKADASHLIKYFLASLTVPEKDLWVNLSPYEKDRIVPQSFGQTEMGRDLLAEDYMLKQITASLIYPEGEVGRKFWKRIYEQAAKRYGTTNVPINTFNKVWIVPEKALVYENVKAGTAYVVDARLKVMLEQDYLSMQRHDAIANASVSAMGSDIVRALVIPELTREVNEDKNFSQLRQVYNSLILATWYKKKIRDSVLAQVYDDRNKTAGVGYKNSSLNIESIYERYLRAFKKGVFNYIKEESDHMTQETIPRKYFSGGVDFAMGSTNLGTSLQIVHHFKAPADTSDIDVVANLAPSTKKDFAMNDGNIDDSDESEVMAIGPDALGKKDPKKDYMYNAELLLVKLRYIKVKQTRLTWDEIIVILKEYDREIQNKSSHKFGNVITGIRDFFNVLGGLDAGEKNIDNEIISHALVIAYILDSIPDITDQFREETRILGKMKAFVQAEREKQKGKTEKRDKGGNSKARRNKAMHVSVQEVWNQDSTHGNTARSVLAEATRKFKLKDYTAAIILANLAVTLATEPGHDSMPIDVITGARSILQASILEDQEILLTEIINKFGFQGAQKFLKFAGIMPEDIKGVNFGTDTAHDAEELDITLKNEKRVFYVKSDIPDPLIPELAAQFDIGPKFLNLENNLSVEFKDSGVPWKKENIQLKKESEEYLRLVRSAAYALGKMHGLGIVNEDLVSSGDKHSRIKGIKAANVYVTAVGTEGDRDWVTHFIDYNENARLGAKKSEIEKEKQDFMEAIYGYLTQVDVGWYEIVNGPARQDPFLKPRIDEAFEEAYKSGFEKTKNRAMSTRAKSAKDMEIRAELEEFGFTFQHEKVFWDSKNNKHNEWIPETKWSPQEGEIVEKPMEALPFIEIKSVDSMVPFVQASYQWFLSVAEINGKRQPVEIRPYTDNYGDKKYYAVAFTPGIVKQGAIITPEENLGKISEELKQKRKEITMFFSLKFLHPPDEFIYTPDGNVKPIDAHSVYMAEQGGTDSPEPVRADLLSQLGGPKFFGLIKFNSAMKTLAKAERDPDATVLLKAFPELNSAEEFAYILWSAVKDGRMDNGFDFEAAKAVTTKYHTFRWLDEPGLIDQSLYKRAQWILEDANMIEPENAELEEKWLFKNDVWSLAKAEVLKRIHKAYSDYVAKTMKANTLDPISAEEDLAFALWSALKSGQLPVLKIPGKENGIARMKLPWQDKPGKINKGLYRRAFDLLKTENLISSKGELIGRQEDGQVRLMLIQAYNDYLMGGKQAMEQAVSPEVAEQMQRIEDFISGHREKPMVPSGFWKDEKKAREAIWWALDKIPGFEIARRDGNIEMMADLYRQHVLSRGQQGYFFSKGLKVLMGSDRLFLDKSSSPAALLRFALPGLIDEDAPGALRPWEVEDVLNDERLAKKAFIQALDKNIPGFAYVRRKGNIKGMAFLYRKHILNYKPEDRTKGFSKGQTGFFEKINMVDLMGKARLFLDSQNSPAALLRWAMPALVDEDIPGALRPWELEDSWDDPRLAKKAIVQALDNISPDFRDHRIKNDIGWMADDYRLKVKKYPGGQLKYFSKEAKLSGSFANRRSFLDKTYSVAALLRFALPPLVEQSNPLALRSQEIERSSAMISEIQTVNRRGSSTGGIDLTAARMNLQTQNNGGEIKFHLDPVQLMQLQNAPGFVPVIVSVKPLRDLQGFLGIVNQT